MNKSNTVIGFIGTGVMGKSMASHLIRAGYTVIVYNRTPSKTEELVRMGALWEGTVAGLAARSRVIITMVGYPRDVEEVYLGENGIVDSARPGTFLIDMTTSSPSLAEKIYNEAEARGLHSLDAPVSGGDVGAREAKLAIMVGGDPGDFEKVLPVLRLMGNSIVFQGGAGAGQHTKMCNQIAIASNMIGVCEALAYAKKSGLDAQTVLKSIGTGAAGSWSLNNLAPRILAGNFEPGFYVKHFIKDMNIALEAAAEMGLDTPGLALARSLYHRLAQEGEDNSGTQALYKLFV